MDARLIITVVFMVAVAINTATAQNTAATTNTTDSSTGNAATAAPNTTVSTTGNGTTATTAVSNTVNGTTAAPNATVSTTGNGTTAAPTTTVAPPLTTNTTVDALNESISRTGCGKEQLCAAQPSSCDPSTNGSCFFLGAQQLSGQNFQFSLSGISAGYIAASLSPGTTLAANATTYVCANNNGVVKFIGTVLDSGILTTATLPVNSVRGRVDGSRIQCTFAATVPSAGTKATPVGATFQIATGTFNSASDSLGSPNVVLKSTVTDLGDPNTTVINSLSTTNGTNTTASPSTTNYGITLQQSLMQALLITAGVLGLALL